MKIGGASRCQAPRIVTFLRGLAKFFKEGRRTKTIDEKGSILPEECVCKQKQGNGNLFDTFLNDELRSLARVVCL